MLRIKNLVKDYEMKNNNIVHAIRGINLDFRKNEFVSILGPSGCGKTTLLNIIGGLDRYTSGDLIIKGKSTKHYKDRDWDSYRNHSIGFIFQSYNLIPHQTVLQNVELALTISGISRKERKQRALDALEKVGLKNLIKNKPSQMSGGQMQRVAIARALVNNPEIILADEPTGALDSKTSIQVMELLKEVAKDRLVIMVTHNPDLAKKYSTRIVNMFDGKIVKDSDPYKDNKKAEVSKKKSKHSSMKFFTAAGLSFSNLLSKIRRTILVSIAGSIGIIGVSAVLAVSQGVRDYIANMQDDMLSSYPLTIAETSVDATSLLTGLSSWDAKQIAEFDISNEVGLDSMISYLMDKYADFTQVKTNDINDDLMQYIAEAPEGFYSALDCNYGIEPTNNIFTSFNQGSRKDGKTNIRDMSFNGITQMYISELNTVEGFGSYSMFVDLFTGFMRQLPSSSGSEEYILSQYDLLGSNSRLPKSANEMVLVVDPTNQTFTDLMYAQLGYFNEDEFINLCTNAIDEHDDTIKNENNNADYKTSFTFDEIMNKKFTYYPHSEIYSYKTISENVCSFTIPFTSEESSDPISLNFDLTYNKQCDCLIGNVNLSTGGSVSCILTRADETNKSQTSDIPGVWTWKTTLGSQEVNQNFILKDDGKVYIHIETPISMDFEVTSYTSTIKETSAYMCDAAVQPEWDNGMEMKIVGILKRKPSVNFGCLSRGVYFTSEFTKKYMADAEASDIVSKIDLVDPNKDGILNYVKRNNGTEKTPFEAYSTYTYTSYIKGGDNPVYDVSGYSSSLSSSGAGSALASLFSISSTSGAISTDKSHVRSLCGKACKQEQTESGTVVYNIANSPVSVSIYPSDFEAKDKCTEYLNKWNSQEDIVLKSGKILKASDRQELTYEDTIETIIMVIDTLITAITIALVAFTSLALVVSCFMIAVITYISVVERIKEIGIIRSLGGRKKDISRLFITETFMTGLSSGVLGIGITYIFQIIFNICMYNSFKITGMANLTPITALIMLSISIFLSVMSGLIPSMRASNQDPVAALRTE